MAKIVMKAMALTTITRLEENAEPLVPFDLPKPAPGPGEVLIRVHTCGVCHTELDEIEGRTPPPRLPVVPGHEIVGRIEALGEGVSKLAAGDRVGVGWIHESDGGVFENLSDAFRATGRDVHGGYAEYVVVGENYAFPVPEEFSDEEAAPLLCAGAVGYRALMLCGLENGQRLGLTGFGGSGHLVLPLARHLFPDSAVYVFARSPRERDFAAELGAIWTGDTSDEPPRRLHAIIDTTPAWKPLVAALAALRPGGRLVINAIRKEADDIDALATVDYATHLWMEKEIKTVANVTARDIREFLAIAAEIPLKPEVEVYPLTEANRALSDLKAGHLRGAKVLKIF